jgi:hypothetical protein
MSEDRAREDIAFIRNALEGGRTYAQFRGPDIAVWGALVALGYLGTYAFVEGLTGIHPTYVWWTLVALGWFFSSRHFWQRRAAGCEGEVRSDAARVLGALWLGFGITMLIFALLNAVTTQLPGDMNLVSAGLLGLCFFATAAATGIGWLRWVALGWWVSEFLFVAAGDTALSLLLGAALMLGLLSLPGLLLWLRPLSSQGR